MKKSRLVLTAAVLGTGAVMAASFLKPQRPAAPPSSGPVIAKPAVTEIAPARPTASTIQAAPAATTVLAPQAPLFRSATTSAPIDTSQPDVIPAPVRHDAPLLETSTAAPQSSGPQSHSKTHAPAAAMPSMAPPPSAATGLAASEQSETAPDTASKPAASNKNTRKPQLATKSGKAKPASRRVEALFQHPLGMR